MPARAAEDPASRRPAFAFEQITWLGHATVLIETGGRRLVTDPVLRGHVAHLRRGPPSPALPDRVDAVLLSHLHHDHFDPPTLRRMGADAIVVTPSGSRRVRAVRRLRREVHELSPGESVAVGGVRIRAVPAVHDGRRWPLTAPLPALGFVVEGDHVVYFAGDTALFDGMSSIAGGLHVALLPVSGWGPRLGPGHMDPDDAARAVALLHPAIAVPIHWGTLRPFHTRSLGRDAVRAPAERFAAQVRERTPDVRAVVLTPGGALRL